MDIVETGQQILRNPLTQFFFFFPRELLFRLKCRHRVIPLVGKKKHTQNNPKSHKLRVEKKGNGPSGLVKPIGNFVHESRHRTVCCLGHRH